MQLQSAFGVKLAMGYVRTPWADRKATDRDGSSRSPRLFRRAVGNQALQRLLDIGVIQAKLLVNKPGDVYEQEADRVVEQVMHITDSAVPAVQSQSTCACGGTPGSDGECEVCKAKRLALQRNVSSVSDGNAGIAPQIVHDVIGEAGQPLDASTRAFFEPSFGYDFGKVRVHTGTRAAESARDVGALAYTVGSNLVFGAGQYAPHIRSGQRLLAHELTHVMQQGTSHTQAVQRDLKAYDSAKTESMPSADFTGGSSSYVSLSAEAPGLRSALADLIAAGKVKEVKSSDGEVSWFAAQHHRNAQLAEIDAALQKAGYAKAGPLARAIYDIHGEFLYSNQSLTTIAPFYSRTTQLGVKIETVQNRSMTEWEIGQAHRVFGSAIDYTKVTIADGSVSARVASAGGYARTVGNVINFPTGGSRDMSFMVHELTHVWQYQTTGWSYVPKALWAQATEGYSYTDSGKTAEQSLKDARSAGKKLYSYNKEQQGDILSDFYSRLQKSLDVSAWQPFVNDVNP